MRPDLVVRPQSIRGRRQWNVKDPVSMSYFRLRDEEYAILEMLDGQASAEELIQRFERRFAPRRLTAERLQAFLARLHADGLLVSDATGQAAQLLARGAKQRRQRRAMFLANLLAIRLPGVNPAPLLDSIEGAVGWLFSPAAAVAGLALVVAAATLVATRYAEVAARMPAFHSFFTARNALAMLAVLAIVKLLHELGHALVCRRFGGECHELGVMLLLFAPTLYCNVSDSWMFASRWQRIAVAAAGIYVELILAALATFLWWTSEPGVASAMALDVMFVCSVSTLVFNGNPLLRYDGYYVLSDLVDIPNLAQQASDVLRATMARVCLGTRGRLPGDMPLVERVFLFVYAIASTVYRWVLVAGLLWFCYRFLEPYRLERLAEFLAVTVVGGLLAAPVFRAVRFLRTPTQGAKVHRGRVLASVVALTGIAAAVAVVPLPVHVASPVTIEPEDARRIYVTEPGLLTSSVRAGQSVKAGQTLATLANADIDFELARLTGECNRQRLRLENLERRRNQDRTAAGQIPAAKEALADLEERVRKRRAEQERLTLTAPAAGVVLSPPWKSEPRAEGELPDWSGTPLLARNQASFLDTGTLFCLIGDPERVEAVAIVDQADVERIVAGQRALLKLDESAGDTLEATVTQIAEVDLKVAPRQLAFGGELPVHKDAAGVPRPATASYQVRLALEPAAQTLLLGSRGRVKIYAASESLLVRARRWLREAFHFPV